MKGVEAQLMEDVKESHVEKRVEVCDRVAILMNTYLKNECEREAGVLDTCRFLLHATSKYLLYVSAQEQVVRLLKF